MKNLGHDPKGTESWKLLQKVCVLEEAGAGGEWE